MTEFDKYVIRYMPCFIAVSYQRMLKAQTTQEQVKQALHVYDLGLRALTIMLVSQYLISDKIRVSNSHLNNLLYEKLPHLTLDAWKQLFFASLRAYEGKREFFFMPELYDFYWDTSSVPHRRRVKVEPPFERLTQIYIELKTGKSLPDSSDKVAWQELALESRNLLKKIMRSLAFIGDYDLIRVLDYGEQFYDFELHKGLSITRGRQIIPSTDIKLSHDRFYFRRKEEFLFLHPMLVFWESEAEETVPSLTDTGVYDRFIEDYRQLRYVLATLGKTVTDNSSFMAMKALIDTIEEDKRKRLKTEKLTWWQLRDLCDNITDRKMSTVQKRYNAELYLQRLDARQAVEGFLDSEKKGFVLIGKSGVGKSNFLLALREELFKSQDDICLLMYDGAHLSTNPSVTDAISEDFDERLELEKSRLHIEDIWREITKVDRIDEKTVLLGVDAINENLRAKELLRQLDELVKKPYAWLKVILSSRPEAWRRIRRGERLAESLYYHAGSDKGLAIELEPFSYSEQIESFSYQELPKAYARYCKAFKLQTCYGELTNEQREMLREPLNLWLVAKTYQDESIPDTLSATELVEDYVAGLVNKFEVLQNEDLRLLEDRLVPLMVDKEHCTNSISLADLDAAGGALFESIYSDQILSDGSRVNQSFMNLLDAEILVRQQKGRYERIAFKHERFYEYFVGRRLNELSQNEYDRSAFFMGLIDQVDDTPYLWGAVHYALLLTLQNQNYHIVKDLACTQDRRHAHMVTSVLVQFYSQDKVSARNLVRGLLSIKGACLVTRDTALKVAFHTQDKETLLDGLLSRDEMVSELALQYVYHLNQSHPKISLDILESLVEHFRKYGLPNFRVVRIGIMLEAALLLQYVGKADHKQRFYGILEESLKKLLYADNRSVMGKLIRELSMFLIVGVFRQLLTTFRRSGLEAVMEDWESVFAIAPEGKTLIRKLVPYLDYRNGTSDEIEELMLEIYALQNQLVDQLLFNVINIRGSEDPSDALSLISRMYEWSFHGRLDAIYSWEICVTYQDSIDRKWLEFHRDLVVRFYEDCVLNQQEFPDIQFDDSFSAYPLMAYASVWNHVFPGKEVDLIERYLSQGLETGNQELLLHIIDGFGSARFDLLDYRAPLRSLVPLISVDNEELRKHLINALAFVDSSHSDQVSHFLIEVDAPRMFIEKVHQRSHELAPMTMFRQINLFFRDAMVSLSAEETELVVETIDRAAVEKDLFRAFGIALRSLVNELGGGDIFLQEVE